MLFILLLAACCLAAHTGVSTDVPPNDNVAVPPGSQAHADGSERSHQQPRTPEEALHEYVAQLTPAAEPCFDPDRGRLRVSSYPFPGPLPWTALPWKMRYDFSMGGRVEVAPEGVFYMFHNKPIADPSRAPDPSEVPVPHSVWTYEQMMTLMAHAVQRMPHPNTYEPNATLALYDALDVWPVKGRDALVIGSETPWVEATLRAYGWAQSVTTVDHNKRVCELPEDFIVLSVDEFEALDPPPQYDLLVSFSSLEHDGLGRYGDPIHPFADVERMASYRHLLRPGGILLLAIPTGPDVLLWNRQRVYGPARWAELTRGWQVLDVFSREHPHLLPDHASSKNGGRRPGPEAAGQLLGRFVMGDESEPWAAMGWVQPLWVLTPE